MAYLPPGASNAAPVPKGAKAPTHPSTPLAYRSTWNGFPSPSDDQGYPFDRSWSHSQPFNVPESDQSGSPTPPAVPTPASSSARPPPHPQHPQPFLAPPAYPSRPPAPLRLPPPIPRSPLPDPPPPPPPSIPHPPTLPPRPSSARPVPPRPPRPKLGTIRTSRPLPIPPSRSSSTLNYSMTSPLRSKSDINLSSDDKSWSARPYFAPFDSTFSTDDGYYPSNASFRSSMASFETVDRAPPSVLTDELEQRQALEEDGIRRFQSGELTDGDAEWHHLVPKEAIEALPKNEVQRQSIIFELIKSERDYVADLSAVQNVFISGLYTANPPALAPHSVLDSFVLEVFSNLPAVRAHHEQMLSKLFARQREQHPIISSIADIVLEGVLASTQDYEVYIKHYPLAEARHRRELKHNPAYATVLQRCSSDTGVRKRDLVTFLSRPVTRLPRLSLLLDNMARQTEGDHPDAQETDLILGILKDFITSTQPGIAAADAKVKFWSLCETLVFRRGEILDMDLYDEKRTLVHSGTLARRRKTDYSSIVWSDLVIGLLDNYFLITQQESHMGNVKHVVVSRPIPLQFLRIASFSAPSENRRDDRSTDLDALTGGIARSLPLSHSHPQIAMWPFTVFHACAKVQRRYTLYADSEAKRAKWQECLVDTIGILQVQQEANRWFAVNSLSPTFFRLESKPREKDKLPGPIICGAAYTNGNRELVALACPDGVWVGFRTDGKSFRRVLDLKHVSGLAVLQSFDQLIVQAEGRLFSYSLDMLARAAQLEMATLGVWSSFERISQADEAVAFFRVGEVAGRVLVVYAVKRPFRQTTIHALEAVRNPAHMTPTTEGAVKPPLFRPYGTAFYVPKDAFDVVLLQKKIAVCTDKGLTINDPTDLSSGNVGVVPDFSHASADKAMASLKVRCEASKPLGMVRSADAELLIVYEEFGCYITKHGVPARRSGYIRWEIKATSVAFRPPHVLLFNDEFIEIRDAPTGRLEQAIEGKQIRLIGDATVSIPMLAAMQGASSDGMTWDNLFELVETEPLTDDRTGVWDEWGL